MDIEHLAKELQEHYPLLVLILGEANARQELADRLGMLVVDRVIDPTDAYELRERTLHGDNWYER